MSLSLIHASISTAQDVEIFNSILTPFDRTWGDQHNRFVNFINNIEVNVVVSDYVPIGSDAKSSIILKLSKNTVRNGYTPPFSNPVDTYGLIERGKGFLFLGIPKKIEIDYANVKVGWHEFHSQTLKELKQVDDCLNQTTENLLRSALGTIPQAGSLANMIWRLDNYVNCVSADEEDTFVRSTFAASGNYKIFVYTWVTSLFYFEQADYLELVIPIKNGTQDTLDEIFRHTISAYLSAPLVVFDSVTKSEVEIAQVRGIKSNISFDMPDSDNDGLPDWWEAKYGNLNPNDDADGDGLTNLEEYTHGTNPLLPDTDGDGLPDGWEITYHLNPTKPDSLLDLDADGLTCLEEYQKGERPDKFAGNPICVGFNSFIGDQPECFPGSINFKAEVETDQIDSGKSKLRLTLEGNENPYPYNPYKKSSINNSGMLQLAIPWGLRIERQNIESSYYTWFSEKRSIDNCGGEIDKILNDLIILVLTAGLPEAAKGAINTVFLLSKFSTMSDCYRFIEQELQYQNFNANTHDLITFYWPNLGEVKKLEFIVPIAETKEAALSKMAYPSGRLAVFTNFERRVSYYKDGYLPDCTARTNAVTMNIGGSPLNLDSDFDGLPDYWEEIYGLNPYSAVGDDGGDGDPDKDGFTNYQEYKGGSNPKDPLSKPIQDMVVTLQAGGPYNLGDNAQISVDIKDKNGNYLDVIQKDVNFAIKNGAGIAVLTDNCTGGNGIYSYSFKIDNRFQAGDYAVEVSIKKTGYKDGFAKANFSVQLNPAQGHDVGVYAVSWESNSSFNPENGDLMIKKGESIIFHATSVHNYGYYRETDVPVVMQIIDGTGLIKATSNTLYVSVDAGNSAEVQGNVYINTGNVSDLPDGVYKIIVKTELSNDSNRSNDSLSWDLFVGLPPKPANQVDRGSYYYYRVNQIGPSTMVTRLTDMDQNAYDIVVTYLSGTEAILNISSGSCNKSYTITKWDFGSVCEGNLFVSLQGVEDLKQNQYFLDLEIGIKSNDPNIQQDKNYQSVYKWTGTSCYLANIGDSNIASVSSTLKCRIETR
jgi:hypothetical protein